MLVLLVLVEEVLVPVLDVDVVLVVVPDVLVDVIVLEV